MATRTPKLNRNGQLRDTGRGLERHLESTGWLAARQEDSSWSAKATRLPSTPRRFGSCNAPYAMDPAQHRGVRRHRNLRPVQRVSLEPGDDLWLIRPNALHRRNAARQGMDMTILGELLGGTMTIDDNQSACSNKPHHSACNVRESGAQFPGQPNVFPKRAAWRGLRQGGVREVANLDCYGWPWTLTLRQPRERHPG